MTEIPCPACGFLMNDDGGYGSCSICPLCDWEDDAVQLANPTSGGGANRYSLAEAQRRVLVNFPLEIHAVRGYRRGTNWRPLSAAEVEAFDARRLIKHWHTQALYDESEAYWMK